MILPSRQDWLGMMRYLIFWSAVSALVISAFCGVLLWNADYFLYVLGSAIMAIGLYVAYLDVTNRRLTTHRPAILKSAGGRMLHIHVSKYMHTHPFNHYVCFNGERIAVLYCGNVVDIEIGPEEGVLDIGVGPEGVGQEATATSIRLPPDKECFVYINMRFEGNLAKVND